MLVRRYLEGGSGGRGGVKGKHRSSMSPRNFTLDILFQNMEQGSQMYLMSGGRSVPPTEGIPISKNNSFCRNKRSLDHKPGLKPDPFDRGRMTYMLLFPDSASLAPQTIGPASLPLTLTTPYPGLDPTVCHRHSLAFVILFLHWTLLAKPNLLPILLLQRNH